MTDRVAVVGGGAVGATAALELATRDVAVDLYEREAVAAGATGRAAGICYDAFAEDVDAWVADQSMARFRSLSADDGQFTLSACPYVWLAREGDGRRAEAIREDVERMRANGRAVTLLVPDALEDWFPTVRTDDVAVAAVAHDAGYADPATYVSDVVERARDVGARIHENAPVQLDVDPLGVRTDGETHSPDAVLVAAGAHTKQVLADAGIEVPVKPYRVQAAVGRVGDADGLPPGDETRSTAYDGPIVYDATGGFYCRPHSEGLLAGDGTEEVEADPETYDRTADEGFGRRLLERVGDRLRVEGSLERAWAGLCTATPDRDPLLGEVREGVYVATGFQGHGFMRSPALGAMVARAIDRNESAPLGPFDPRRFDGDEQFEIREGMVIEED